MFSGIHSRCDQLEVRKDCARHLLVEDLGFFRGQIGGTPDHVELYQRIGDDMGYPRDAWERATPIPEMNAIVDFFRRLAYEIPWSASLCTTAFIEAEVVEVSQTVGQALTKHYGCRPDWGAMNYLVHEEVEQEEAGETEGAILKYIRTADDRRVAEDSMREMHRLLDRIRDGTRTRVPRSHITRLAALVREAAFSPSLDARSETNRAIAAMSAFLERVRPNTAPTFLEFLQHAGTSLVSR